MRLLIILFFLLSPAAYAEAPSAALNAVTSQDVWLNTSRKLTPEDLQGRILLLDFWTLGCINCMDVIPDLKYLEHTFGDKLTVIGVHSAKFAGERDTQNIRSAVLRYGLTHPVVNDANFGIWNQFGVHAWPTLVLINPTGTIEKAYEGEGNRGVLETDIWAMLAKYKGHIVTSPLPIALESAKESPTVLSFPGKIIAGNFGDLDGNSPTLFIADSGHNRIVLASPYGEIRQTIGSGEPGFKDGSFERAQFFKPQGLAYQPGGLDNTTKQGLLYVADTGNHALRLIDFDKKMVTTLAGTGEQGAERAPRNSPAQSTALSSPWDVAFYPDTTHLAIAMAGTQQLWNYDIKEKTLSLLAGNGVESLVDGRLPGNSLAQPSGLSALGDTFYFVDAETSSLRMLAKDGSVITLIGKGLFDFGYMEGFRADALLQHSLGLLAIGNDIYIADTYNHSIRRYDIEQKMLHNFAGHNLRGAADGPLADASFNGPGDIAKLGDMLYVADTNNNLIRTIDLKSGSVATLDVAPKPTNTASAAAPNLQTLAFAVTDDASLEVTLSLQKGWHINKDAPSELALFKATGKSPVRQFAKSDLLTGTITLSGLPEGESHLKGTIYYCEDKANSLCKIKSFDVKLTHGGNTRQIVLPLD